MTKSSFFRLLLISCFSFATAYTSNAGFLDDVNKLKQKAGNLNRVLQQKTKNPNNSAASNTRNDKCRSHPRALRNHELPPGAPRNYNSVTVYQIQRGLCQLGYYSGEQNSIFDDRTRQAIKKYQQKRGLFVDGEPSHMVERHISCDTSSDPKTGGKNKSVCDYAARLKGRYEQEARQKKKQADETKRIKELASKQPPQIDRKQMELLKIKFSPASLDQPNTLRSLVSTLYPAEWNKMKDNEFEVRRRLPGYKPRIIQLASKTPTTYRQVWSSALGSYDFDHQGYSLVGKPPRGGFCTYKQEMPNSIFIAMPPNQAESLSLRTRVVHLELVYEVTGAGTAHYSVDCAKARLRVYEKELRHSSWENGRRVSYTALSDPITDVNLSQPASPPERASGKSGGVTLQF